jgi:hypothetical protein
MTNVLFHKTRSENFFGGALKYISLIGLPFIGVCLFSCDGGKMAEKMDFSTLSAVPADKWEVLAKKKIYFGHMSVGYNIMEGVKDILKKNSEIRLEIVESKDAKDISEGGLLHSKVGKNRDPQSKVADFEQVLKTNADKGVEIAFLKFCYLDVAAEANPQDVFEAYRTTVDRIKTLNPKMELVHFTVPLTLNQRGPKALLKRILGKTPYGVEDNMKRQAYNQLLRQAYQGKEAIFDLAEIESTYPDGKRASFRVDGQTYFEMVPEYTDDGGHLNPLGRKKVAEQLLLLLVNGV